MKKFFYLLLLIATFVSVVVGSFLGWEFYYHKENFITSYEKLLSAFMVILSALMASTAAIISINTTKELKDKEEAIKAKNKQEEEQKVEQEEKIYMSYIIRNIEFLSEFYGNKFKSRTHTFMNSQKDFNLYALQFKSLNDELQDLIKKLEDKKILHILFYREASGPECVIKILTIKKNIYSISKHCEILEKELDVNILNKLTSELLQLAEDVIKIKDGNCS